MGSLKDSLSIVKEGLCVWECSECGHCGRQNTRICSQSEEGELFWFLIYSCIASVGINWPFRFFDKRREAIEAFPAETGYGVADVEDVGRQRSNVIMSCMQSLCIFVLKEKKTLKDIFTKLSKLWKDLNKCCVCVFHYYLFSGTNRKERTL